MLPQVFVRFCDYVFYFLMDVVLLSCPHWKLDVELWYVLEGDPLINLFVVETCFVRSAIVQVLCR